ncbi:MAG: hypothetical protein II942_01030 [Alphaproteobacteria bacterium]|nr:hypothetical protein [Alphaproteobacteria bacterium]
MSPKTKAIWKTVGAVLAGALTFAYLPLVSFAAVPQAMGWLHFTLAAIYPWLGDALLGASVASGVGLAIKKIWGGYFAEKRIEKKIKDALKQKALEHKQAVSKQKTRQYDYVDEAEMPRAKTKKAPAKLTRPAATKAMKNRRQKEAA